ncbi:MAG: cation-transporting P-type ATPase [Clostridia bacterium]
METKNWFNKSVEETVEELQTNATLGLSNKELERKKNTIWL